MKVIILAAGMGSRMHQLTKSKPKCFLKVNGLSLIERLLCQLKKFKVKDISIVTGYKHKVFNFKNINYFHNKKYNSTNMVYSLMQTKKKLNFDTLIIYSDIIISDRILEKMLSKNYQSGLFVAVDKSWKKYWSKRFSKQNQDLESLKLDNNLNITEIGKKVFSSKDIDARFIGVIRISKKINNIILNLWNKTSNKKKANWGISGRSLNNAYTTDLINKLINLKVKCQAVIFKNGWYEFDTKKDYYYYKKNLGNL